jgi:hypothetical protein
MKKALLVTTVISLLFNACNWRGDRNEPGETASDSDVTGQKDAFDAESIKNTTAIWDHVLDTNTNEFVPTKLRAVSGDTLRVETVEYLVNQNWPDVQIDVLRTAGDTVFVSIPESTALTQSMGTAGAEQFLVSTTYSFTEIKGIKYVHYAFEVGDHAMPGVYNRDSWNNKKNIAVDLD